MSAIPVKSITIPINTNRISMRTIRHCQINSEMIVTRIIMIVIMMRKKFVNDESMDNNLV